MTSGCLPEEIVHKTTSEEAEGCEQTVIAQLVLGVGMTVGSVMVTLTL